MTWRMLDLFSGIGGFSLAAQWCWEDELEIVAFCEIDKFCQKILKKHWPEVPIIGDIKKIKENRWGTIDLICGGFPCTQTSTMAAIQSCRKGLNGKDSSLWFEYLRVVQIIRPIWILVENPQGVLTWKNTIETGLERAGYRVSRFQRTAWSIGAPHLRRRVFFIAHSMRKRCEKMARIGNASENAPLYTWPAPPRGTWRTPRARTHRMDDGIPNRVDRLKSLGNAIVPQVAYQIFKGIKQLNEK